MKVDVSYRKDIISRVYKFFFLWHTGRIYHKRRGELQKTVVIHWYGEKIQFIELFYGIYVIRRKPPQRGSDLQVLRFICSGRRIAL